MITSDKGLRLALDQLGQVYMAIASLRAEHPHAKPEWLAVMAEGFIDHARQLQGEIDEYTGIAVLAKDGNGTTSEVRDTDPAGERLNADPGMGQ
jgi:hypothetical protein